jgi:hypothetical protein
MLHHGISKYEYLYIFDHIYRPESYFLQLSEKEYSTKRKEVVNTNHEHINSMGYWKIK